MGLGKRFLQDPVDDRECHILHNHAPGFIRFCGRWLPSIGRKALYQFADGQDGRMDIYLETERLVLRRFTPDDVDAIVELDSDPEVMFFINGGRPTPRAEVEDEVLPFWLAFYEHDNGYGFWAAIEKSTGQFLGWFHFRPHTAGEPVELGYRLRRPAWGKGYATEGSRALIEKGFTDLDVERVYAETMVVNTASRRVMEKAGLRYVRTFVADWPDKIPGDEHGDVEYALTRAEWLTRNREVQDGS
jgi:RimJ/RimL family protein N-acetyltransferase